MQIRVLKSKLSYASITHCDLYYVGSISIDEDWMKAANLIEGEEVQIVNLNNGERLTTYVITAPAGSKIIGLNGPAARRGMIGDQVFIISYALIDPENESLEPKLIQCGEGPKTWVYTQLAKTLMRMEWSILEEYPPLNL